jgi:hypothetical protein
VNISVSIENPGAFVLSPPLLLEDELPPLLPFCPKTVRQQKHNAPATAMRDEITMGTLP